MIFFCTGVCLGEKLLRVWIPRNGCRCVSQKHTTTGEKIQIPANVNEKVLFMSILTRMRQSNPRLLVAIKFRSVRIETCKA